MDEEYDEGATPESSVEGWRALLEQGQLNTEDRQACLINLANALSDLAEERGEPEIAEEAASQGLLALELARQDSDVRLVILSDLSTIYLTWFELAGLKEHLDRSLELIEAAVAGTASSHDRRCARLLNLCNSLCAAFEAYGHRHDIDRAIEHGQMAISLASAMPDDLARAYSNTAKALSLRYEAFQIFSDMLEAERLAEESVEIAEDESIKAVCAANLVGHLVSIAERDCSDETVERALAKGRRVLEHLEGAYKALCAHNMSYLLRLKYERVHNTGNPKDLQLAVDYAVEAINNYPGDDAQLSMYEDQLVLCLEHAFLGGDSDKLELAIRMARSAVSRFQQADPRRGTYTNHLVSVLRKRGSSKDLHEAADLARSVFEAEGTIVIERIDAGQMRGSIHCRLQDWQQAAEAFQEAISLIPLMARNAGQRSDQQYVLGRIAGISPLAASAALESGKTPEEAFAVLEKGRGVLTRFAILTKSGLPAGIEGNTEVQPYLSRYRELKERLGGIASMSRNASFERSASQSAVVTIRSRLQAELHEIEGKINNFMGGRAPVTGESDKVSKQLRTDFAVAFNVTNLRSDAFVVTESAVQALPLPTLLIKDVTKHIESLVGDERITAVSLTDYRTSNKKLSALLRWLWNCAIRPVLDFLRIRESHTTAASRPRICWIAAGAMGLFPLHAAGIHRAGSEDHAMNFITSSYAVTLEALDWCREQLGARLHDASITEAIAEAFTMAKTPSWPDLDITVEIESFLAAVPRSSVDSLPRANVVREKLQGLTIAHFACHGESDANDPSNSSLLLFNEQLTEIERLTVYELAETNTPRAWLVFLSACQTADLQSLDHIDEVIHLAGAFQIAGFPQVVGTLWEAESECASQIARGFYEKLRENGTSRLTLDTAVLALHDSIISLRAQEPEAVLSWAPFVLYGA